MTTLMAKREPSLQVKDPDRLKATIRRRKHTYDTLSEAVEVHRSMIGHLCTGRTLTCRQELAERIEDVLGVKRGTLFKKPDYQVLVERRGARAFTGPKPKPVEQVIDEDVEK